MVLLPGCQRSSSMDDYKATVRSAHTAIPVAVEIEQLFPETDHFITHFGFDTGPKTWNTEAYFGDRYHLTMQVKVNIDYVANQVKLIGEPVFFLTEIERIEPLGSGHYKGDVGRFIQFDLDEWKTLFEHGGDLSSIGFIVKEGKVAHFWDDVAAVRRDRVRVRLIGPTDKSDRGAK